MDFPICYASRQINTAKRNYSTTEREGLGMIFEIKKYRYYLLANKLVFFIDHQALLYLVNKPCNTGRIVRWFLILLEFDFTVVVKQGKTHLRADQLSRMVDEEKPIGIDDNLLDAYLFKLEVVPKWSKNIVSLLTNGNIHNQPPQKVEETRLYALLARRLYKHQKDKVLSL